MGISEIIDTADAVMEVELTPGVVFPDWSAVTSEAARRALAGSVACQNTASRWANLDDHEDRVRRAILRHYLDAAVAPSFDELATATGLDVGPVVERLAQRDIIALDGTGRTIAGAYPFTDRHSGHQVHVGDASINAMCAIDALGVGAMCRRDVTITSTCAGCAAPIGVITSDRGRAIEAVSPDHAVVWMGLTYDGACAANSLCREFNFFCSDDHLEAAVQADMVGHRLSLDEALEVGRAIFTPLLA